MGKHTAIAELQKKSLLEIQRDTALTWAYRAAAARELGLEHDAIEYQHEALEHAALTGSDDVLDVVRHIIKS